MSRLQARLTSARDDSGLTLIELVVATVVAAVVLSAIGLFMVNISKSTVASNQSRVSTGYASNVENRLAGVISTATTVTSTGATPLNEINSACSESLSIYSYTLNSIPITGANATQLTPLIPSRWDFSLTSGTRQLVANRYVATVNSSGIATFPSTASTTTTYDGTLLAPSGTENTLFTYIASDGSTLPLTGGCLPAASYQYVAQIRLTVKMASANTGAGPTRLTQIVNLTNIVATGVGS